MKKFLAIFLVLFSIVSLSSFMLIVSAEDSYVYLYGGYQNVTVSEDYCSFYFVDGDNYESVKFELYCDGELVKKSSYSSLFSFNFNGYGGCDLRLDYTYSYQTGEVRLTRLPDGSYGYMYTTDTKTSTCNIYVKEHTHNYYISSSSTFETCVNAGTYIYECDCGDTYSETISPTGHNYVVIPGKSATCTATGLTDGKKCLVCNKVIEEQKEIKPLGHKEVTVKAVKATYTKTGLTAGKKCKTCGTVTVKQKKVAKKKLKKVTISTVKSTKAKQASVNWKTVSDATGYIVEYSTSKKFTKKTTKKVTVKKAKSKKTTLKKLKSGKKYYIRIRAYKTVGKKTVYGAYSSVKTVKVK